MSLSLAISPLSIRLAQPLTTSRGVLRARQGWLVRLTDDEGRVGFGEATPLEELGGETPEQAHAALELAAERLGKSPDWNLDQAPELTPAARFALDTAMLDLAAQRAGLPLAYVLNPSARDRVEVNALLQGGPEALAAEARAAVEAGFGTAKLKVAGRTLEEDLARVRAVREAASGLKLRIDANGGWTEAEALAALRAFEPLGIELCEQPVAAGALEALERLHGETAIPLAADEALVSAAARERLIERRAVDVLVLKPALVGGLVQALRTARAAEAAGLGAYVTSGIDGEVARAATAQLAAALPGARFAHGLAVGRLLEEKAKNTWLEPARGQIVLPTRPGLGLAVAG